MPSTKCPHCRGKLLSKVGDTTRLRVKGAVEFDASGKATSTCFWCSKPVEVPVKLSTPADEGETFTAKLPEGA